MDDATALNADLSSRLAAVRASHPALTDEMARDVIHAVFDHSGTDGLASSLLAEVADLGRAIANTKAEIASLRVDDITGQHIPAATDELSAIVAHTIKGKGVSFMEGVTMWHYRGPTAEENVAARAELEAKLTP